MREAAERRQQLELEHEQALAVLSAKQQEIDLLQKVSSEWLRLEQTAGPAALDSGWGLSGFLTPASPFTPLTALIGLWNCHNTKWELTGALLQLLHLFTVALNQSSLQIQWCYRCRQMQHWESCPRCSSCGVGFLLKQGFEPQFAVASSVVLTSHMNNRHSWISVGEACDYCRGWNGSISRLTWYFFGRLESCSPGRQAWVRRVVLAVVWFIHFSAGLPGVAGHNLSSGRVSSGSSGCQASFGFRANVTFPQSYLGW